MPIQGMGLTHAFFSHWLKNERWLAKPREDSHSQLTFFTCPESRDTRASAAVVSMLAGA